MNKTRRDRIDDDIEKQRFDTHVDRFFVEMPADFFFSFDQLIDEHRESALENVIASIFDQE